MDHDTADAVLREIADTLECERVPYFLICGTCLGAAREGDFIAGDADIDIGILWEDAQWWRLKDIFAKDGFTVRGITEPLLELRCLKLRKHGIHIDLCGWVKHGQLRVLHSAKQRYALVHDAYLLENTEERHIRGRLYPCPYPVSTYLEREYGDWRTPIPKSECGTYRSHTRHIEYPITPQVKIKNIPKQCIYAPGVWDLLHVDHLRFLAKAKAAADILVVGVQEDASVKLQKGKAPIIPTEQRAEMVNALRITDIVTTYSTLEHVSAMKIYNCNMLALSTEDNSVHGCRAINYCLQKGHKIRLLGRGTRQSTSTIRETCNNEY